MNNLLAVAACQLTATLPPATVPGVVISHVPASTGSYVGSPSIAILPNGDYVASHDLFGPQTTEHQRAMTLVFRSTDRGRTWTRLSEVNGAFWSSLFVHRGALYMLGPERHHGNVVIRRSVDGGATWTTPVDDRTGRLTTNEQYHCAPMPVIEHAGRLWRAFERRDPPQGWGLTYCAGMFSAPVDADLLRADSWTLSNFLPSDQRWHGGQWGGWLEGNAVVTRDGHIVDVLRVDTPRCPEQAAIVEISDDGRTARFDPATGLVDFPGGAKKFCIRYDAKSDRYWSLATIVPERHQLAGGPAGVRNTLALTCSRDLRSWTVRCVLLYHPDIGAHGFQYVDWVFDGDDVVAACRTGYDDGLGGAHNAHDANYLTCHRIARFRELTMADSVPFTDLPPVTATVGLLHVTGRGWQLSRLADGEAAFGNRAYVWDGVPAAYRGWQFTRTNGGQPAAIAVTAKSDTTVHLATAIGPKAVDLPGWELVPGVEFRYNDAHRTALRVYRRAIRSGETVALPQGNWTGSLALLPVP